MFRLASGDWFDRVGYNVAVCYRRYKEAVNELLGCTNPHCTPKYPAPN